MPNGNKPAHLARNPCAQRQQARSALAQARCAHRSNCLATTWAWTSGTHVPNGQQARSARAQPAHARNSRTHAPRLRHEGCALKPGASLHPTQLPMQRLHRPQHLGLGRMGKAATSVTAIPCVRRPPCRKSRGESWRRSVKSCRRSEEAWRRPVLASAPGARRRQPPGGAPTAAATLRGRGRCRDKCGGRLCCAPAGGSLGSGPERRSERRPNNGGAGCGPSHSGYRATLGASPEPPGRPPLDFRNRLPRPHLRHRRPHKPPPHRRKLDSNASKQACGCAARRRQAPQKLNTRPPSTLAQKDSSKHRSPDRRPARGPRGCFCAAPRMASPATDVPT